MKAIEKIFGGINLTWPKLIIAAIIAGGFTAAMAIIPEVQNTSFNTIAVTFEVWILFGFLPTQLYVHCLQRHMISV